MVGMVWFKSVSYDFSLTLIQMFSY